MNRISEAFKGKKAFIPFITGGDPDIATTERLITALAENGADIIEIGIPFSDPVAEGPVIQAADERALSGGCTVDKLFEMVSRISGKVGVPLLFMTYYNPIFAYGAERFCENCKKSGIAGLIVPDLPFEEANELKIYTKKAEISLISLIAPTSNDRVKMIAKEAEGFLYCVSSLGVTGVRANIGNAAEAMIKTAKTVSDIPCAVGFGVSTEAQAAAAAQYADGVIVGSAIVKIVAEYGADSPEKVAQFARGIKKALDN
ncbi:MAG: tryptophan synthase subunit alpha [Ruminococcus sp.]|jgi:tryptophan synthase alpha chain|nr:tryptophan synthase subunit alpha [Ruminococcus sp.]